MCVLETVHSVCIVEFKFTCACRKCYDFSTMMKYLDVVFSEKPCSPNSNM